MTRDEAYQLLQDHIDDSLLTSNDRDALEAALAILVNSRYTDAPEPGAGKDGPK
jgi:hypothetical protein